MAHLQLSPRYQFCSTPSRSSWFSVANGKCKNLRNLGNSDNFKQFEAQLYPGRRCPNCSVCQNESMRKPSSYAAAAAALTVTSCGKRQIEPIQDVPGIQKVVPLNADPHLTSCRLKAHKLWSFLQDISHHKEQQGCLKLMKQKYDMHVLGWKNWVLKYIPQTRMWCDNMW